MAILPGRIGPYRYRPDKQIAQTHMSQLWSAHVLDGQGQRTGEMVVLKLARLDNIFGPANQRAIDNEEFWLCRKALNHESIVKLRPIAVEGQNTKPIYRARAELPGQPWFVVTDYLPGGTLEELIQKHKRIGTAATLHLLRSLADTLAFIHGQGCVHRDLKPDNIMFRQRFDPHQAFAHVSPILIDFGIASVRGERHPTSGSGRWLPPECSTPGNQQSREIAADPKMDIYPLGQILYYALTGTKPPGLHGGERQSLAIQPAVLNDVERQNREELARRLTDLITRCTNIDPTKRPLARQVSAELAQMMPLVGNAKPRRSKTLGVLLSVAALILVAAAYAVFMRPDISGLANQLASMIPGMEVSSGGGSNQPDLSAALAPALVNTATSTTTPVEPSPTVTVATATPMPTSTPLAAAVETATVTPELLQDTPTITVESNASVLFAVTDTPEPSPTATNLPTSTLPPTSTFVPTPIPTATRTPTIPPTSTLAAQSSPTATPNPTSTPLPPPTSTARAIATTPPTATPRPPTATNPPPTSQEATPTRPPVVVTSAPPPNVQLKLVAPLNGVPFAVGDRFVWDANYIPGANENYQVAIWGLGQSWNQATRLLGTTKGRDSALSSAVGATLQEGLTYYWGVLLTTEGGSGTLVSNVGSFTYAAAQTSNSNSFQPAPPQPQFDDDDDDDDGGNNAGGGI